MSAEFMDGPYKNRLRFYTNKFVLTFQWEKEGWGGFGREGRGKKNPISNVQFMIFHTCEIYKSDIPNLYFFNMTLSVGYIALLLISYCFTKTHWQYINRQNNNYSSILNYENSLHNTCSSCHCRLQYQK